MKILRDTMILKTIIFLNTINIIIIQVKSRIIIRSPSTGRLNAGEEDGRLEVKGELDVGEVGQAKQLVENIGVVLRLLHTGHGEDDLGDVGLDSNNRI